MLINSEMSQGSDLTSILTLYSVMNKQCLRDVLKEDEWEREDVARLFKEEQMDQIWEQHNNQPEGQGVVSVDDLREISYTERGKQK
jgi:hypothetical protein